MNYMGWISEIVAVNLGIRQGCRFSTMAFVIGLELLAIKIRTDQTVQGIKLPNALSVTNYTTMRIRKLALYADDITLFLRDKNDLERVFQIVKEFSEISQFTLKKKKTEAMWLGCMQSCKEEYCNIKWKTQFEYTRHCISQQHNCFGYPSELDQKIGKH